MQTFTQSLQLLAGAIGQTLVEPVVHVSLLFQGLTERFHALSPAIQEQVGHWITMGTGISLGGVALAKVAGVIGALLPVVGALGSLLSFTLSPVRLLVEGLVALGTTAPETFTPILEAVRELAGTFMEIALPALQGFAAITADLAGSVLKTFSAVLQGLSHLLNTYGSNLLVAIAAAVTFASPMRLILIVGSQILGWLSSIHPALGALAVALGIATYAWIRFQIALAMSPWGTIITVIGVVIGAILAISGTFNSVGESAGQAAAKFQAVLQHIQAIKEKGVVDTKDVMGMLVDKQQKQLAQEKDPEKRKEYW